MVYFGLFFAGVSMSAYAALHIPKKAHKEDDVTELPEEDDVC